MSQEDHCVLRPLVSLHCVVVEAIVHLGAIYWYKVRKYFTLDVSLLPPTCLFSLPAAVCAALCVAQLRLDLLSLLGTEHTFAARCNYCISGEKVFI